MQVACPVAELEVREREPRAGVGIGIGHVHGHGLEDTANPIQYVRVACIGTGVCRKLSHQVASPPKSTQW